MVLTIEYNVGHSRTPANQSWDQVPGRSQLAAPAINAIWWHNDDLLEKNLWQHWRTTKVNKFSWRYKIQYSQSDWKFKNVITLGLPYHFNSYLGREYPSILHIDKSTVWSMTTRLFIWYFRFQNTCNRNKCVGVLYEFQDFISNKSIGNFTEHPSTHQSI